MIGWEVTRRIAASAARALASVVPASIATIPSGVSKNEIAKEYSLSEERLRTRHEEWLAQAESEEERERLERTSQTPADSMRGVFEELERRYGSVEGYLRHGGLTDDELAQARARLRN